jgi:hypothetical protein
MMLVFVVGSVMPLRHDPLPQDAARLTRIILSPNEENADLKARVAFLEGQLFGTKSEKMTTIDPTQAILDLGDLSDIPVAANGDVAPVSEYKTQARRSPTRNIGHSPKYLPRYDEVIEPESKICPCCSFELHRIGMEPLGHEPSARWTLVLKPTTDWRRSRALSHFLFRRYCIFLAEGKAWNVALPQ